MQGRNARNTAGKGRLGIEVVYELEEAGKGMPKCKHGSSRGKVEGGRW